MANIKFKQKMQIILEYHGQPSLNFDGSIQIKIFIAA